MPKVQMAACLKVFIGLMGVVTLFVAMAHAFVAPDDASPYVEVEPRQLALEIGRSGQFECTGLLNYSQSVVWLHGDGTRVPVRGGGNVKTYNITHGATAATTTQTVSGLARIYSKADGKLVIDDASMNDTQDFRCSTADQLHGINVSLKVFIMPSYYLESIIIISINACLLVVFFTCMTAVKVHEINERKKTKRLLSGGGSCP